MEDANELIERAREAGFIDTELKKHAPHAKDCLTRANAEIIPRVVFIQAVVLQQLPMMFLFCPCAQSGTIE